MHHRIVKIIPQPFTRFHFGQMKLDHDLSLSTTDYFCRSDTLFAGFINSYERLNGDVDDLLNAFKSQKVKVSSIFYFIEKPDKAPIYLLPYPAFLSLYTEKDSAGNHKKLNKIKFVSKNVWESGLKIKDWLDESKYGIIGNDIVLTKEEFDDYEFNKKTKIIELHTTPKSSQRNEKNIFYQTDLILHPIGGATVGLYFFYECDKELELPFKNAVNVLAFSGFGGEVNLIGRTLLTPPIFDKTITFDIPSEKYSNISLYNPADRELSDCEYFETSLRGGRRMGDDKVFSKVVRMINEGAVFKKKVNGRIVSLGLHENGVHEIFRYGIPYLIPINYE